jgi:phosphoenolpyruvate carboxylase
VIAEIAHLNLGSRPASRRKSTAIEDLRAIPWVFSWAQCRLMLPGWYGFGSALRDFLAAHGQDGLHGPAGGDASRVGFFRTLLSNMDMVLAKSDLAIAAALRRCWSATRSPARSHLPAPARPSGRPPIDGLLAISGEKPNCSPTIRCSQALDPQPLPLPRPAQPPADRAAASRHARRRRPTNASSAAIHLTINGVAAGLRNSG